MRTCVCQFRVGCESCRTAPDPMPPPLTPLCFCVTQEEQGRNVLIDEAEEQIAHLIGEATGRSAHIRSQLGISDLVDPHMARCPECGRTPSRHTTADFAATARCSIQCVHFYFAIVAFTLASSECNSALRGVCDHSGNCTRTVAIERPPC
jgi:hypothetical protein